MGAHGSGPAVERGRDGTIAYNVEIESSEPGARIEANGMNGLAAVGWEFVGMTPDGIVMKRTGTR